MIRKFKMPGNVVYELSQTGMIKASSILDRLLEQPSIKKINDNVATRLDNLLVDQLYLIESAEYDALMNEVILHLEKAEFCDICEKVLLLEKEKHAHLCIDCIEEHALSDDDLVTDDDEDFEIYE